MSNNLKIGIVMDPVSNIKPQKDSTLAIMLGAQSLGADLFYMEQDDLYIEDDKACATIRPITVFDDNTKWYEFGEAQAIKLETLGYIIMRKDPPVDKRFIHACYMLEHAARNGVKVINNATALHRYNEKIFATHFPEFCPPYQIVSDFKALKNFLNKHEKIIIKPLDAMGGQGVFMVRKDDVNFEVIWEMQTDNGRYPIVAQAFIPAIDKGDKRILIIDGVPVDHALARIPKSGSIRGNLAAGASYEVRPLTDHEMHVATTIGKRLINEGITLSGIDMIGDFLIEVNITSPTGLREISTATGRDLGKELMRKIIGA